MFVAVRQIACDIMVACSKNVTDETSLQRLNMVSKAEVCYIIHIQFTNNNYFLVDCLVFYWLTHKLIDLIKRLIIVFVSDGY